MKLHKSIILIGILAVFTVFFAYLHLNSREDIPENALSISYKNQTYLIDIQDLDYNEISGKRLNGKGEEILVEGIAISLKELMNQERIYDYDSLQVVSDDSYTASINKEEVDQINKAYLMKEENTLRLIVFGDTNSKRSVSNVVKIIVE